MPHFMNKYQDVEDERLLREITKMAVNKSVYNQSFTESQKLKIKQRRPETSRLENQKKLSRYTPKVKSNPRNACVRLKAC